MFIGTPVQYITSGCPHSIRRAVGWNQGAGPWSPAPAGHPPLASGVAERHAHSPYRSGIKTSILTLILCDTNQRKIF